ncbi:MAG TPA: malonyl-ACP O-methyltransferase BioC [Gammaproteobacteria bacterium]|nr:malonyl-ACP O-methyltransferase BioC [Gammaproteobacteria bacterium]
MQLTHFSKKQVADSFSKYAPTYEEHAFLQKEIAYRLLEHSTLLKMKPLRVLDLGCGTGILHDLIKKHYPTAEIVELDIAWGMVSRCAKNKKTWSFLKKKQIIQGDMEHLPFKNQSFDIVFSNCALQWSTDLSLLFKETERILQPKGAFFFATFGPDTLKEVNALWQHVDNYPHVHTFLDMHPIGDLLLQVGFHDPVMDQEFLQVQYQSIEKLFSDLKCTGARNLNPNRNKGLTTPKKFHMLKKTFQRVLESNKNFSCTYEVLYGHALKTNIKQIPTHCLQL